MLLINLVRAFLLVLCLTPVALLAGFALPSLAHLVVLVLVLALAQTLGDIAEQALVNLFDQ